MISWVDSLAKLNVAETHPIYSLLMANGTLSTILRSRCDVLSIQVIKQELATASVEEQQLLNISEDNSFIREVFLLGDQQPLVKARVVAPMRSYLQFKNTLDNLGEKPIGETFLYTQAYTRSPFQYTRIQDKLTRRSVFDLQSYPIMVQEKFLF